MYRITNCVDRVHLFLIDILFLKFSLAWRIDLEFRIRIGLGLEKEKRKNPGDLVINPDSPG